MCRCASLVLRPPVIPSKGCARGSANEDVVLYWRAEAKVTRRGTRWGSAPCRLECQPAAGALLLGEPLGDVGHDPTRTAYRECGAELSPVNQEGEPPTRECPIRMQQKSHLRVRKRYDFAGCRGCNRRSLSLPSLKRMPPTRRDQTQIREENHIDVIFLSAADIQLHISAGRDAHRPFLKSAQCRFESDWGHGDLALVDGPFCR